MSEKQRKRLRIKRGWRWALGGAAVLVGLAAWQAFRSLHREPYLLERATRVVTLKQDYANHLWLSSHEVLLIPTSQNGILVDTSTGRQQPVNTGSEAIGERMGNASQRAIRQQDILLRSYLIARSISFSMLPPEQRLKAQAILSHLPNCFVDGFATSPDGKREAYLLQVWRSTPVDKLDRFVQRLLPHRGTHSQSVFVLCLSDANGGHMHELAWEPIPASLQQPQLKPLLLPWPHSLQFTPDGKHVSFIYKDALWSVPVE